MIAPGVRQNLPKDEPKLNSFTDNLCEDKLFELDELLNEILFLWHPCEGGGKRSGGRPLFCFLVEPYLLVETIDSISLLVLEGVIATEEVDVK